MRESEQSRQSVLPGAVLLDSLRQYSWKRFRGDLLAGLTVGVVAVPLAMALAIAVDVPPEHGLYTAIVAGLIISLTGGSRFNVSGPTAAFVVILLPVVHDYGLGGLLVATTMAGLLLIAMGLARLGRLIQFIPYPVVVGFTAGIGVVIATLQIKDFLGLAVDSSSEHYLEMLLTLGAALPSLRWEDALLGVLTLGVLIGWSRLRTAIPGHLVALVLASVLAWLAMRYLPGFSVDTIAARFEWTSGDESGLGIPPLPPLPVLPWHLPGADGEPLGLSFSLVRDLMGPALAIAMLGAIESLLCAVVADGLTGTRHRPNAELVGQGLGNIITPFFGGITATAAIARTATNIRSGAFSPIAGVIHALVVLAAVVALAGVLGHVPMAALAALLLVVAWNMSEARHFVHILRGAPASDVVILLVCFLLTVFFDMVLAVGVGVALAAALFIQRMANLTQAEQVDADGHRALSDLPDSVAVFDLDGPLFFGAAEQALSTLHMVDPGVRVVIVDMQDVPSMDMTAIASLEGAIREMEHSGVALIFSRVPSRIIYKLRRAGIRKRTGQLTYCSGLKQARRVALRWLAHQDRSPRPA
ncbi:C4-dicarboxylic acid transporter DauA [Alkalilimnicola ehrlichii]|uniref:C4-dicarboxylic acid transporter DauA n=1 Tax=Alkalilimnicola ehrlichii TaxID=351052 RepID=UPI003B9E48F5